MTLQCEDEKDQKMSSNSSNKISTINGTAAKYELYIFEVYITEYNIPTPYGICMLSIIKYRFQVQL